MALNYNSRYPSQTDTDTQKYPYGKAKNISTEISEDGTPWERDLINDQWGFFQSLLTEGDIVPNGTPDAVGASQYIDALDLKIKKTLTGKISIYPSKSDLSYVQALTLNPLTSFEVKRAEDGTLPTLYADDEATSPLAPPYKSDTNGNINFYIKEGLYEFIIGSESNVFRVERSSVIYTTMQDAVDTDPDVGTLFVITDRAFSNYKVVTSADTGGYYQGGLTGGKKLKYIGNLNKDAEAAGLLYTGLKSTRTSQINSFFSTLSEGDMVDVPYRISLPKTTSDTNTMNFSDVNFPNNVTVTYRALTRENVKYLNNISAPYGAFPEGVPVNEDVLVAPYHVGRIMDLKTPASYNTVQDAHRIADEYNLVGKNYMSYVWRVDGKTLFQDLWDTTQDAEYRTWNLTPKSGDFDGGLLVNRLTMDGQNGNFGVQRRNAEYPLDIAGASRIVKSADNQYDNVQRHNRAEHVLEDEDISRGYTTFIDPSTGVLTTGELVPSAEGSVARRYAYAQTLVSVAGDFGANAADSVWKMGFNTVTNRSLSTGGTINSGGSDYAEYMFKASDFTLAKGDVCGVNDQGKLTTKFSESVTFVIKTTNPSMVGGDDWFKLAGEPPEGYHEGTSSLEDTKAYEDAVESVRASVDRIAFCGRVPVNVQGTAGDYIIPVEGEDDTISIITKKDVNLEEYLISVGKCIESVGDKVVAIVKV